ncbi:hypothetical protein ACN6LM_002028 [Streptomyces sp. SAS_281]|uniref:hypothetical protein n=1 Tax=Streptomyces sp. SAS_281 TaxID=3412744 RepID=UPI00403CF36D
MNSQIAWPEGVLARYLTVGGATVEIVKQSGYTGAKHPTEHFITCGGCGDTHFEDWGWSPSHDEFGTGPQPDFDADGTYSIAPARAWAQSHAETCRAMPKPTARA